MGQQINGVIPLLFATCAFAEPLLQSNNVDNTTPACAVSLVAESVNSMGSSFVQGALKVQRRNHPPKGGKVQNATPRGGVEANRTIALLTDNASAGLHAAIADMGTANEAGNQSSNLTKNQFQDLLSKFGLPRHGLMAFVAIVQGVTVDQYINGFLGFEVIFLIVFMFVVVGIVVSLVWQPLWCEDQRLCGQGSDPFLVGQSVRSVPVPPHDLSVASRDLSDFGQATVPPPPPSHTRSKDVAAAAPAATPAVRGTSALQKPAAINFQAAAPAATPAVRGTSALQKPAAINFQTNPLCPGLVIPMGKECSLVVPQFSDIKASKVTVDDAKGQPIFRISLSIDPKVRHGAGKRCMALFSCGEDPVLFALMRDNVTVGRLTLMVHNSLDQPYGIFELADVRASGFSYTFTNMSGQQVYFNCDQGFGSIDARASNGELLAVRETQGRLDSGAGRCVANIGPGVDSGFIVLCLLGIEWLRCES